MGRVRNWNEMTLEVYHNVVKVLQSDWGSEIDMNLALVSSLTGEDTEDMNIDDLRVYLEDLKFLETPYEPKLPKDSYEVGDRRYVVFKNANKMRVNQYIDFQNFLNDYINNMSNISACFLIPEGKLYGDGYDPLDEASYLNSHLTVDIMLDIMFFFVKLLNLLTQNTLRSSEKELKRMLKKSKEKVERIKILRSLIKTRQLQLSLKNGDELFGLMR